MYVELQTRNGIVLRFGSLKMKMELPKCEKQAANRTLSPIYVGGPKKMKMLAEFRQALKQLL